MEWSWATSVDEIWRSAAFPMWLTLAAAVFFGVIVLFTLLRAEKSVANGALTVITLLAIGIAVAATIRTYTPSGRSPLGEARSSAPATSSFPALACLDELAGDTVLAACEKAVFASAESTAAALSYTASQISRLTAVAEATDGARNLSPEFQTLRRAIERDRYGLVARVLVERDHCTPSQCAAFRSLTDQHQIAANIDEHVYDSLVSRYAPSWNVSSVLASPVAAPQSSVPPGRPTNAEFPSSASTPPVSIMNPEPGAGSQGGSPTARAAGVSAARAAATPPAAAPRPAPPANSAVAAAKKPPASKPARPAPSTPVQLAPGAPTPAPEATGSND
jgi:hypothetical protein